jgi:Cu(I)/Ag(I) efflux system membrane fusion protein
MKLPRNNRIPKAAVAVVVLATLALAAVSCRKKSDAVAQADHTGTNMQSSAMPADHGSTTGMDQSMPGMKMPMSAAPKTQATGAANMNNMRMPGGEHTGHAAFTNEVVPGRGPVDLDQAQRQFINIRTRPATRTNAVLTIRTVGIVAYDETKLANVNARIMGWAEKLYVNTPGQFVEQGGPLLDIYSPELYSAQYEYLLAYRHCERLKHIPSKDAAQTNNVVSQESMTEAETLAASARKRLKLWEITDDQIAALEKSGKPTDTLQLRAPVSGYVIQKNIEPAQMVRPGMTLYRVADLTTVWINADIYEYELPLVKVGQKAAVTGGANPGRVFEAKVDFIYAYSENKTRTTTARLVMDNRDGLFKPDTYVNAEIKVDQGERLMTPATAVFDTGTRQYVFVEAAEGHFIPRRIELGAKVGDQFIVNEGLAEGEKVVVDGNFLLDSESQLRAAGSGGGHQH